MTEVPDAELCTMCTAHDEHNEFNVEHLEFKCLNWILNRHKTLNVMVESAAFKQFMETLKLSWFDQGGHSKTAVLLQ